MRALSTDQAVNMFCLLWKKTQDLDLCVEAVYQAGMARKGYRRRRLRRPPVMSAARLSTANVVPLRARAAPLLAAVAARNGLELAHLLISRRAHTAARYEAMFVLRSAGWLLCDIALAMHLTNHTTVVVGLRAIEKRFAREPGLRAELLDIAAPPRVLRSVAA